MSESEARATAPHQPSRDLNETDVVQRFLDLLCRGDIDEAARLLAVDVRYTNVSLPTLHGRERVRAVLLATLGRDDCGFDVRVHTISANGSVVLTERTDILRFRRLRVQFWVCGRFDVRDGQITLWRDYFDWLDITVAAVRGLLAMVIPALGRR